MKRPLNISFSGNTALLGSLLRETLELQETKLACTFAWGPLMRLCQAGRGIHVPQTGGSPLRGGQRGPSDQQLRVLL